MKSLQRATVLDADLAAVVAALDAAERSGTE
jgi:hypothetical protein